MDNFLSREKQPSILIVDDNPQNLQVLGKMLQENDFEIEFATNGRAALEWLSSSSFDLVLLDINMPEMNGFEVCSAIRSNEHTEAIPIIFISADTERDSILKGFELGAQDYVTKPFDSRELLARVRTQLQLKESLRKLENLNNHLEAKVRERTEQLEEANKELKSMNTKLLELDEAKAGFLNLISHEIRTPLNGIVGPLQLLKDSFYVQELALPIEMLDNSISRLERFSMDALLITKLKARRCRTTYSEINIEFLLTEIKDHLHLEFPDRVFDLTISTDPSSSYIKGDKDLIYKCLHNIMQNSILYCSSECRISAKISSERDYLVCEINDNGDGFEQKILETGFELFAPGKKYYDSRVGMGLPMAEMITEVHGGKMEIGNSKSGGAFVKLYFSKDEPQLKD